jgi:hypothetical protein
MGRLHARDFSTGLYLIKFDTRNTFELKKIIKE